jgi:hypothetical protein
VKVPQRVHTQPPGMRELPKDRRGTCPKCSSGPGWRCTKVVAGVTVPRKTVHPERRAS